jgi:nitrogen fixation/metabolism regulation signal transduction histidine kinase
LAPGFQLKYTAMVVGVTVVVASVLGLLAYRYSTGQTQMLTIQMADKADRFDAEITKDLERYSQEADRKVALNIIGGVLLMTLTLGVTGILVTHRLVGPVYRLKSWVREVREGHLRADHGSLRKHDELQDLFEAFHAMVASLRAAQEREIAQLDAVIEISKRSGLAPEAMDALVVMRERMRAALD